MSSALDPDPRLARRRIRAGAALLLALVALAIAVVITAVSPRGATRVVAAADRDAGNEMVVDLPTIYIHVLGQVAQPGLFTLTEGSRVVDAIAAAGGFTDDADRGGVNLARPVVDGEQLYVPAQGEAPPPGSAASGVAHDGRINLNTADAAALESLPRIGPALAQRIIAWRESHGRFSSVDDLLAVSGIGQSTLESLRDLVTV